jgi:hypothetical protein
MSQAMMADRKTGFIFGHELNVGAIQARSG